ncbi:MAG: CBS domain-containing protein, partial [Candidatus Altiarchaeales archaeon]|nr:CBS domain-containing protein [Candidatus Altiarchaeales archaeon]
GTQHSPQNHFGTLTVTGDLKQMKPKYLKAASLTGYGTTLYVGIGCALPVLDEKSIKDACVGNSQLTVGLIDYSVPSRNRPKLAEVSYQQLFSGQIQVAGKNIKTAPLSSIPKSLEISDELTEWIEDKSFYLTDPVETLPVKGKVKAFQMQDQGLTVQQAMTEKVVSAEVSDSVDQIARHLIENDIDQIPIVDEGNRLVGIVTSLDITRGIASDKKNLKEVMTREVVTSKPRDSLYTASQKLDRYGINSTPVVDESNHVVGIITAGDINRHYRRSRK